MSKESGSTKPPNLTTAPTVKLTHAGKADQLVNAKIVGGLLGLSGKTVLNRWRGLGLPAPIKLGAGPRAACRWWLSEVQEYVWRCEAARRQRTTGGHIRVLSAAM